MVNIIIYLKKTHNAKQVVRELLVEKLIATASIDENNISYKMENGVLIEELSSVITAQSKSLLFSDIVKVLQNKFGEEIPIISTPIIGSTRVFEETIISKTMLV
ncbi:MAG: hypothetical protein IPN36_15730 [Bacteroidetes bacterium]|nr:hypothetical protein [Bacteroidota bacterium]MBL0097612.1 hypothetical protein [Bacteroidota bacterium]